jgi:hypothetical protein
MTNEMKNQMPAVPEQRNVFERAGDEMDRGNAIIGVLLKFSKGDWLVGQDGNEIAHEELVAVVPGMVHGWVRWEGNKPAEQIMGPLVESFVPPRRSTLGYDDQTLWELGANSKPRDPWQLTVYLPMCSLDATEVFTFATGSDGGKRHAIGPLCREYGAHIRQHPDELPVVRLDQDSYAHSDRSIGRVKYPTLPVLRWVAAADYVEALTAIAGRPVKLLEKA